MSDGRSVADRVERARFRPTWRRAYDMGDVDQFLDQLAAAARREEDLGGLVAGARFRTVTLRQGYSQREVDEFLSAVAGPLAPGAAAAPPVTAPAAPEPVETAGAVVQEQKGLFARLFGR